MSRRKPKLFEAAARAKSPVLATSEAPRNVTPDYFADAVGLREQMAEEITRLRELVMSQGIKHMSEVLRYEDSVRALKRRVELLRRALTGVQHCTRERCGTCDIGVRNALAADTKRARGKR